MSATKGRHDGKAFFGCLVLVGLIITMGNDLAQADVSSAPMPQRKPLVPIMEQAGVDNSLEFIAAAILDTNALRAPAKRMRTTPTPSIGARP